MVKVISFFKLIRWPNLLMIAFIQYVLRFFLIESLGIPHQLSNLGFFLLVLCSISAAAAGYIINDILDVNVDKVNKPNRVIIGNGLTVKSAWVAYVILNLLSVGCGYLVSASAGFSQLWLIPVLAIALLYLYSTDLKRRLILGNFIVSLLVALPIFLVALFDLLPAVDVDTQDTIRPVVQVIMAYSAFAFWINFIREIVKDIEDSKGDSINDYQTLAIVLGATQTKYIITILSLALLAFTGFYTVYLFSSDWASASYILLFVDLPLIWFLFQLWKAQVPIEFKKASTLLKLIMIAGILSIVVFTLALSIRF